MELALLTGVNVVLTIYDDQEKKLMQYKSDSIEVIQEICKKKPSAEEEYCNEDVCKYLFLDFNTTLIVFQSF